MVDVPTGRPVLAVSLYGRLRYADQSVLRAASDLLPIFDTPLGERVVLAGDLNIHTHSDNVAERRRAGPILALLESFGLRDLVRQAKGKGLLTQGSQAHLERCPCGLQDCSHVRTHRHQHHAPGRMANNDYIYATEELAGRLGSLTILNGDDDPSWHHSDHAPMIARFEF
jgi:exonuclease III